MRKDLESQVLLEEARGPVSLQDGLRRGVRGLGIPRSGPMDAYSAALARLAAGSTEDSAVVEMAAVAEVCWRFEAETVVAVAGLGFDGWLGDQPLRLGVAYTCKPGQRLRLLPNGQGSWSYLSFRANLLVDRVFGSAAAWLGGGESSLSRYVLRVGTRLRLQGGLGSSTPVPIHEAWQPKQAKCLIIRVLIGADQALISRACWRQWCESVWRVVAVDRMGLKLAGCPPVEVLPAIRPSVVLPGTVQWPSGGQPIVLMADGQTTGGYPRVAQVIAADIGRLAQAMPGSLVRFRLVSWEEAVASMRYQQRLLSTIAKLS